MPALGAMVTDAVQAVLERDAGQMTLMFDERKGLVGPEAFRPRRPAQATRRDGSS